MESDMTIHKYENVNLVRLDYSTFHLQQVSKHHMLINIDFLALINPGTMNIKLGQGPLPPYYEDIVKTS